MDIMCLMGLGNLAFWPMQPKELAPAIYLTSDVNVIPLAENIYRTALPSKTATCLACGKPIVFCIGQASHFAQKLAEQPGIRLIDSDDAEGLVHAINDLRKSQAHTTTSAYNLAPFSRAHNSRKYAAVITHSIR